MKFSKYQGAGNDFILIDNRENKTFLNTETISYLCDRHFGIGADGLILIENSTQAHENFAIKLFNSDGSEVDMCGNGSRCSVAFAYKLGIINTQTKYRSKVGEHLGEIISNEGNLFNVKIKMSDVNTVEQGEGYYLVNTGVPHCVIFVENVDNVDLMKEGKQWRHNPIFPEGANVDFVEICGDDNLKMITFERGIEGETLACGTGATAVAIATLCKTQKNIHKYNILTKGGKLGVSFDHNKSDKANFSNIWLEGPATLVFEGEIELE